MSAEKRTLLASFFFSSKDERRNHSGTLFATLVYQLSFHFPTIRQAVSHALDLDPFLFTRSLKTQFLSLVIEPLLAAYRHEPRQQERRLIVIDGLDECADSKSQLKILDAFNNVLTSTPSPICVLLCSRPENEIMNHFSSHKTGKVTLKLFLGDEYGPSEDIKKFLLDSFDDIRKGHILKHLLPNGWPKEEHVDEIVKTSSGQFIYAAITVRYVEDSHYQPHERLKVIVNLQNPIKDSPFAQLDALYTHILSTGRYYKRNPDILAFLIIYRYGPSSGIIEQIIGMEPGEVEVAHSHLGSIVRRHEGRVELLHKSFADFMFNSKRSKALYRNRLETHAWHMLRILQIFSSK